MSSVAVLLLALPALAQPAPATAPAPPPFPGTGLPPAPPASKEDAEFLRVRGNTGMRMHDPSTIIQCGDEFWIFCTGIRTPSFRSRDLRKWTPAGPVNLIEHSWIADAVPGSRDRNYWAPDIIKVQGRYMLFFTSSRFGRNTSGIGVIYNKTLDPGDPAYSWTDGGLVVFSRAADNYNAIDPAPFLDSDGKLWLAFGSFWSGIKLIELDPATGHRVAPDSPSYSLAHAPSIEAPYLYSHDGYYYLFASYGLCCRGVNSTYHTRVGRSKKITGPYLDRDGVDMMSAGGTNVLDRDGIFIGPGHAGIIEAGGKSWISCHFYDGSAAGRPKLAVRPLTWDEQGWPLVGKLE